MVSLAFLYLQFGSRRIRPKAVDVLKVENLLYLTGGDFDAKIGQDTNSEETSNSKDRYRRFQQHMNLTNVDKVLEAARGRITVVSYQIATRKLSFDS